MTPEQLFPLLPEELRKPSSRFQFKGDRSGADLVHVTFGSGRPAPLVNNEAGKMVLGKIFLAAGTRLWAHKGGLLAIGDGTVLDAGVELIAWMSVRVGKRCYLGWDVLVMDTDLHAIGERPLINKPVSIGDDVRIGARAMILKGVTIGDGVVIHPGSIVTRNVPAGAEVRPPDSVVKGSMSPHG